MQAIEEQRPPSSLAKLSDIIARIIASGAKFTDIHIEPDACVMLRQSGYNWVPAALDSKPVLVSLVQIEAFLNGIFTGQEKPLLPEDRALWKENLQRAGSLHPALNLEGKVPGREDVVWYRMRCTAQRQMMGESIGLVVRRVPEVPESIKSLGLPVHVERMVMQAYRGLIIVTGPTGSGKSTTLAAMVGEINRERYANIITIEDPVEYIHDRDKAIINHREIGLDVRSFADGVRDALRFVPDVIVIGEIRDADTMKQALRASESGHLVLASMHASTTVSAIRKMLGYLADSTADQQSLPYLLVGVIAQALVADKDGSGEVHLASEFLDCSDDAVLKAIVNGATGETKGGLAALEKQMLSLASGEMNQTAVWPMLKSLKLLVNGNKVDVKNALAVLTTNDEKQELNKMLLPQTVRK
jgi:pilus retraction protein PilT